MSIEAKLNKLSEWKAQRDVLLMTKQDELAKVLTADIVEMLDGIETEFAPKEAAIIENITAMEDEIKQDVLKVGSSVKGEFLQAVWAKGRTTWDTDALAKLEKQFPILHDAKNHGKPSVTIRVVGK